MATANLMAAIDAFLAGVPPHTTMRLDEAEMGHTVIVPGDVSWLPADEWDPTIVVSRRGSEIRLIALLAKQPGTGALTRTIAGIVAAGLIPVIVEPTREMAETLTRKGWAGQRRGSGWTAEMQWRMLPATRRAALRASTGGGQTDA